MNMNRHRCCALFGAIIFSIVATRPVTAQTLVWSEEFDGDSVDRETWTFDVGGSGFGNQELQFYTARPDNVRVESGHLVIEAHDEDYNGKLFTSARLKTHGRFAYKYGTIEARIRVPDLANGLWPAFWLLGNNIGQSVWPSCGEIDILEMGSQGAITAGLANRRVSAAGHWEFQDEYALYFQEIDSAVNLNNDYHLFRLSWTPTFLRAYLDGVEYWTMDISAGESLDQEEFHRPYFMLVNLAVGGINFVQITDPGQITAPLPAQLLVDWIRLYDNPWTELYYGEDIEENGPFGVFTETTPVDNAVIYGTDAELYVWNNMTATVETPFEGSEIMSFHVDPGAWFGMGVFCLADRNMRNYENGYLHLHMKTSTTHTVGIGIASSAAGESWLDLVDGGEQFGLVRDGQWHEMLIPLSRFSNIDFNTIKQLFMFRGEAPGAGIDVAFDNVYWTTSEALVTPENGSFGVFTENAAHKTAGEFQLGVDGEFYIWENTLQAAAQSPYEGSVSMSLASTPGPLWFGAAFTPNLRYNLSAFRYPSSLLHFAMKTSSNVKFKIGMRSGSVDDLEQEWITFETGNDPYGFVRDGQWHVVEIPMADIIDTVDLTNVGQIFELLGVDGPIGGIELDDICFLNGGEAMAGGNGNPTADAGADQVIVLPTNSTVLDGTQSTDDGVIDTFAWQQFSGPTTATLNGANTAMLSVSDLVEGAYVFRLTVTDDELNTDTDDVTVTVTTPAPTADAGPDQVIALPQDSTTLPGSGSDADGTITAYQWTQVSGPATATLTDDNTATATASDLYEGTYVFELTVTDNDLLTGSDQMTVEVTNPPVNIALNKPATASSSMGNALAVNGGFELGTGAAADNWSLLEFAAGSSIAIADRVNTVPNSGSWRLSLSVAGAANGGPAAEAQQLTSAGSVIPGNSYDMEAQIRRVGAFGPGVVSQIAVEWLDSDGSHGGGVKGTTGFMGIEGALTESYASFGFPNVVAPAGADAALIKVRLAGGAIAGSTGEIACDDVTLVSAGGAQGPDLAVDGNAVTRWVSEAGDPQWIEIDLGATYEMDQVVLDWAAASALDYDIDVSDDGANWSTVYTNSNGSGGVESFGVSAIGSYIRLYAYTGNTANGSSLNEFEVYGALQPGDIDDDGDVDFIDLSILVGCMTGPAVEVAPGCHASDLNLDAAVDLRDYAKFQAAFTGP